MDSFSVKSYFYSDNLTLCLTLVVNDFLQNLSCGSVAKVVDFTRQILIKIRENFESIFARFKRGSEMSERQV